MNYKNDKQEKEAFNLTISDALVWWQKAGIAKTLKYNVVKKIKSLLEEWKQLRKSKSKNIIKCKRKEK